ISRLCGRYCIECRLGFPANPTCEDEVEVKIVWRQQVEGGDEVHDPLARLNGPKVQQIRPPKTEACERLLIGTRLWLVGDETGVVHAMGDDGHGATGGEDRPGPTGRRLA